MTLFVNSCAKVNLFLLIFKGDFANDYVKEEIQKANKGSTTME